MATSRSSRAVGRRGFLGLTAATGGAAAAGGLFQALVAHRARALTAQACTPGAYGPLKYAEPEDNGIAGLVGGAPILMLPEGFKFAVVSVQGQLMDDGYPVPHAFDGMCAVPAPKGKIRLIRNHEDRDGGAAYKTHLAAILAGARGPRPHAFDDYGGGGTTTVDVKLSKNGVPELVGQHWSLVGSVVNCAGGVTPWNTWITCEEDVRPADANQTQTHGYCFEVSGSTEPGKPTGYPGKPVPLTGLGRFQHEAVAVDPDTGMIYQTEDAGSGDTESGNAGFYRWEPPTGSKPAAYGDLALMHAAGSLKMLKVVGVSNERLYEDTVPGTTYACEWVTIPTPNPSGTLSSSSSSRLVNQGKALGAALFKKLEGCWYDSALKKVWFVASGDAGHGLGQVWSYDTVTSELELVYAPDTVTQLDNPDNVCVSPRGGLVLCEDSSGVQYLRGLTTDGKVFDLARNVFSENEFAGACFSPDGNYLFVNIMGLTGERTMAPYNIPTGRGPRGVLGPDQNQVALTLAIWGPWAVGCL